MTDYRDHLDPHPSIPFEDNTARKSMTGPLLALFIVGAMMVAAFFLAGSSGEIGPNASPPATEAAPASPVPAAQ